LQRSVRGIAFPELPSALESLRIQMKLLARAFRGRPGLLIRSLLAEAQFDPELKRAFRDRWIMKRRAAAQDVIKAGILAGELPAGTDPDALLDAPYGGLYYRLLMGHRSAKRCVCGGSLEDRAPQFDVER
jgi:hypothetical protein